jgi:hypothetical protein
LFKDDACEFSEHLRILADAGYQGLAELQRRIKLFGECKRLADETSAQFCEKLRVWLERDLPQTKSPLHPPRQTDDVSSS